MDAIVSNESSETPWMEVTVGVRFGALVSIIYDSWLSMSLLAPVLKSQRGVANGFEITGATGAETRGLS